MWQKRKDKKYYLYKAEKRYKKQLILIIFLLIIASFISFLFWQQKYLTIEQIIIHRGNKQINNQDENYLISEQEISDYIKKIMQKKFLFFFHQNTILSLTKSKIKKELLKDPRLQEIKIEKKWPKKIIVNFSEKQPAALISILGDKDYYLSSTGQLISPAVNILRHINLPLISDKTSLTWQDSRLIKSIDVALNLLQKKIQFNNKDINFQTAEIDTDQGVIRLKLRSNEGWQAFFLPTEDINQQIANLKFILDNYLSDSKSRVGLEYIDLRFGNRIYYK
jgi:cell division septal protein FtsQ